jgi:CheY-like chemotaxis protein
VFNLLVIDLRMPEIDGFEMVRQMRPGVSGNPPIVMMVNSSGLAARSNAMQELGVSYHVLKPVKRHELYAAVSEAMANVAARAPVAVEVRSQATLNGSAANLLDRPLSILLADDSPDNRLLITAYLKKSRYVLDEVEDGQMAVDHFIEGRLRRGLDGHPDAGARWIQRGGHNSYMGDGE